MELNDCEHVNGFYPPNRPLNPHIPASFEGNILLLEVTALNVCEEAECKCLCMKGLGSQHTGVFGFAL